MVSKTGTRFGDNLVGTNDKDLLFGIGGNDLLLGLAGDDRLFGGSERDTLRGGAGEDELFGGSGNDILQGTNISVGITNEIDELTGGLGADTFVLGDAFNIYYLGSNQALSRSAEISDFRRSEGDKIQLKGNASQYSLSTGSAGTAVFTDNGADLLAFIPNVTNLSFAQDFVFV
jgi:Ca2+-binding RTX toxin-like protein